MKARIGLTTGSGCPILVGSLLTAGPDFMTVPSNLSDLKPLLSLSVSGDISTKAAYTRRAFQKRLVKNLAAALARAGFPGQIADRRDRIEVNDAPAEAADTLARVFGVQAVRVARCLPSTDMDDIVQAGGALFADRVDGRRFAVRARRVGNSGHPSSMGNEVARQLGAALVQAGGRVDLDHPEVTVHVELRRDDTVLFGNPRPGPGGLPVGTSGKALTLISGGFDSAVAAWQMLRRGLDMDFVLFDLAGAEQVAGVQRVLSALEDGGWLAGSRARLFVVDFRPVVALLRSTAPGPYWQVMIKRLMVSAAEKLARHRRARALVTGEALGQVSSQTLINLGAIEAHLSLPVLRPLVGTNKEDIVALARHVGTYEASAGNAEFCALDGGKPATRARLHEVDEYESRIDAALIDRLVDEARAIDRPDFGQTLADEVSLDHVPEGATVVDLRSRQAHENWAWPDSVQLDFEQACRVATELPADRHYVLVCEYGLKSAWLAGVMRRAGMRANSFAGGTSRLMALQNAPAATS